MPGEAVKVPRAVPRGWLDADGQTSWLNILAGWVDAQRVPAWGLWLGLWAALLLPMEIAKWADGSLVPGAFHPLHVALTGVTVFMLAACWALDRVAGAALERTRPALTMSEVDAAEWQAALTTTPGRALIAANIVGIAALAVAVAFFADPAALTLARMSRSSPMDTLVVVANLVALSTFLYHTVHQLRLVRALYATHVRIDLFRVRPLQAFSVLTALTGLALIVANYVMLGAMLLVSPILALNVLPLAITATMSLTAIVVFVWPLLDLRARMADEKYRLLSENADELRIAFDQRRRMGELGQLDGIGQLKDVIEVLTAERATLEKLPTMPWQASTARGLGTTLLLPLVLLALQRMLERVLG